MMTVSTHESTLAPPHARSFEHGEYYEGPHDDELAESAAVPSSGYPSVYVPLDDIGVLMDNRNLIATNIDDNLPVLRDIAKLVKQ